MAKTLKTNKIYNYIILGLLILFVIILLFYYFNQILQENLSKKNYADLANMNLQETYIFINNLYFKVEVASTPKQREIGLSNRTHLDKNSGMLFVFEKEGRYPFWMKDTYIPLDMIWIDKNGLIVDIAHMRMPEEGERSYTPIDKALYVLEIYGGTSKKNNIKIGNTVTISKL